MYALVGRTSGDILTYKGRPLVHHDRTELEYLFDAKGVRVVQVSSNDLTKRSPLEPLELRDHPGLSHVRWPLRREDFC